MATKLIRNNAKGISLNTTPTGVFSVVFLLWISGNVIMSSAIPIGENVENLVTYGMLGFFFLRAFNQRYVLKEFVVVSLILLVVIISMVRSDTRVMLATFLAILSMQGVDEDKLLRRAFVFLSVTLLIIVGLSLVGATENLVFVRGTTMAERSSLGFRSPTHFGFYSFEWLCLYFYSKRNAISPRHYLVEIPYFLVNFFISNSYTAIIASIVLVGFLIISNYLKSKSTMIMSKLRVFLIIGGAISNFLSVFLCFNYRGLVSLFGKLPASLSARFHGAFLTLQTYGVTWFGQSIRDFGKGAIKDSQYYSIRRFMHLDISYMAILLRYGLLVYIIFSLVYLSTMFYLAKKKKDFLLLVFFVFAIYGVAENVVYNVWQNIFLIVIAGVIFRRRTNLVKY